MRTLRSDGPDNLSRASQQAQAEVEPGLSFVVRLSRAEAIGKLFCYQFRKKITDWGSVVVLGSMKLYQGFPQPQLPHHPPEWEQEELQPGHSRVIWTHNEVNLLMHEPQSMSTSSDGESPGRWTSAWRPREVSPGGEHAIVLAGPPQSGGFLWAERVNSFSSLKEDAAQPPKGPFEMSHWLKMFHVII